MIVVSNPLDAMVYTAWKASGFPTVASGPSWLWTWPTSAASLRWNWDVRSKTSRLCCSVVTATAWFLAPLHQRARHSHHQLLPEEQCVERAKVGGGEIVKLMGTNRVCASQWVHPDGQPS